MNNTALRAGAQSVESQNICQKNKEKEGGRGRGGIWRERAKLLGIQRFYYIEIRVVLTKIMRIG